MDLITPDFGLVFWQTLTLLTVMIILGKFAWNPILSTIQNREDSINASIDQAEKAKTLISELELEKSKILETAHTEKNKILAEALNAKNAILEEAQRVANLATEQAIQRTKSMLEDERKSASLALKQEVANLSVQIAEKLLTTQLTDKEANNKFMDALIKRSALA
jgi:F-type H+-transporting ATPase subunit b